MSRAEPLVDLARFTVLHAAWILVLWSVDRPLLLAAGTLAMVCAGAFVLRGRKEAAWIVLGLFVLGCAARAPDVPNHALLVSFVLAIAVTFAHRDHSTAAHGLSALSAIVLFWAGVQKLFSGTWTGGQTLAYEVAHSWRFRAALGWLATSTEIDGWRGSQCYLPSWPLAALGNVVWIVEIALAIAIAWPRTRKMGALCAIVFVLSMVFVARELTFAMQLTAVLAAIAFVRTPRVAPFLALLGFGLTLLSRLCELPGGGFR